MAAPAPRVDVDTLRFVRAPKRHNRRERFKARPERYEAAVRQRAGGPRSDA